MVDTVFHSQPAPIRVSHQQCTTTDGLALAGLVLTATQCQPNTLSTVTIGSNDTKARVHIHWESFTSASELHVLYCTETKTLFVGGGTVSATIRVPELTIVHENTLTLFWSFEWCRGFVLELGELDCYLYRPTGQCVGHAPVDPPYEYNVKDAAINFQSIVAGSQWIEFPPARD